ncbi:vesicle associated protein [Striga asiatica]|uniref:Vesicle associated protein n=1 Tax=Striga asiatica TaxID=4170 RepID=A0A5A7PDY8_STRAF|nr:vesicle associated protein [Striga asiatica]
MEYCLILAGTLLPKPHFIVFESEWDVNTVIQRNDLKLKHQLRYFWSVTRKYEFQAQKEAPTDMQCKDKFLLQSVVASEGATPRDITAEMFNKEQGNVEECKLKVVYVAPRQPPSPVAEGSDEGVSPRGTVLENGIEGTRTYVDSQEKLPEVKSLVMKLSEEKAAAIQQGTKLRQELVRILILHLLYLLLPSLSRLIYELLKRRSNKRGGVSMTLVIIIGFVGVILGYLMKRT